MAQSDEIIKSIKSERKKAVAVAVVVAQMVKAIATNARTTRFESSRLHLF